MIGALDRRSDLVVRVPVSRDDGTRPVDRQMPRRRRAQDNGRSLILDVKQGTYHSTSHRSSNVFGVLRRSLSTLRTFLSLIVLDASQLSNRGSCAWRIAKSTSISWAAIPFQDERFSARRALPPADTVAHGRVQRASVY
jgi:hypothetical protein